jgi:hypothetical protein
LTSSPHSGQSTRARHPRAEGERRDVVHAVEQAVQLGAYARPSALAAAHVARPRAINLPQIAIMPTAQA